jgi:hypothetical protein
MITQNNLEITEAVEFVISQIRLDIQDGLYEGATQLDSFTVLHDYCDANDYLFAAAEQFCPFSDDPGEEDSHLLWQDWTNEVSGALDTRLFMQPITI